MTLLGKITVTLSDDPRYANGQTYDIVLATGVTPEPANIVTGSMDEAPPTPEAPPEPSA